MKLLQVNDKVLIRIWTDSQNAEWIHGVTSVSGKYATLDNGHKVKREVGANGELTVVKGPPSGNPYPEKYTETSYTFRE